MNPRAPNLIHGLTFDISFAGAAPDGLELADWIKAALLPVMEEVFDQHNREGELRRIEQLEIDLGTVSRHESRSELARRLFARLSEALGWSLESATATSLVEEREQQLGAQLLDFLRTGRLAWSAAADTRDAHRQLLAKVLESAQAAEILRTAINDPQMLTRLLRQFDAAALESVARMLFQSWPEQQRAAAKGATRADAATAVGGGAEAAPGAATSGGVQAEAYWRNQLQSAVRPQLAQSHREELLKLRRMWAEIDPAQQDALRDILALMAEEVRLRLANRTMASLSPEARSDLALILRARVQQRSAELGAARIETMLQLLLAGEDVASEALAIVADTGAQHAVVAVAPPQDGIAEARRDPQASMALLVRVWETFDPAQRNAFRNIWRRLSAEMANRNNGHDMATLEAMRKSGLTLELERIAAAMLKSLQYQWPDLLSHEDEPAFAKSAVQLLMAGGDATAAVSSMLSRMNFVPPAAAQRDLIATVPPHGVASVPQVPAALQERKLDLALLKRILHNVDPAQREAFRNIWQRLSIELMRLTGGRAAATISVIQKADLSLTLRPVAETMLKELRLQGSSLLSPQDERDLVRAAVQLLVDGDSAVTTMDDHRPASPVATTVNDENSESTVDVEPVVEAQRIRVTSPDASESLALLTGMWRVFDGVQRDAFRGIWQRLTTGLTPEISGKVPKADLASASRPVAEAMLKEFRLQGLGLISPQQEMDLVQAVVKLLAAGDSAIATVEVLLARIDQLNPAAPATIALSDHRPAAAPSETARSSHVIAALATGKPQITAGADIDTAAGTLPAHRTPPDVRSSLALLTAVLQTMKPGEREVLRSIWRRLSGEVASRTGGRAVETLSNLQLADFALTLQTVVNELLEELGPQSPESTTFHDRASLAQSVIRLLLAGGDAIVAVETLLDATPAGRPAEHATPTRSDNESEASLDDVTISPDARASLALLTDVWRALGPLQREAIHDIWRRLSVEVVSRATPGNVQRAGLALTLRSVVDAMLRDPRHQWPRSLSSHDKNVLAQSVVHLLLAGDDVTAAAESMLTGTPEEPSHMDELRPAAPATSTRSGDAPPVHLATQDVGASLALLTSIWRAFAPLQREAFRSIWQRLSADVASRVSGRAPETLSSSQRADLASTLRPVVDAMLKEPRPQGAYLVSPQDETDLARAALQLVLADDSVIATVEALLADVKDHQAPTTSVRGDDEPEAALDEVAESKSMARARLTQLTGIRQPSDSEQREAFRALWQRLSVEMASRTGGRAVESLSDLQKADLALTLRPVVHAMLKESRLQLPESSSLHDTAAVVESILSLLLAEDGAMTTAESILAVTGDQPAAAQEQGRVPAAADNGKPPESQYAPQNRQDKVALLARSWANLHAEQRDVFKDIWQRLSREVAIRTASRPLATLSTVQKTDLSLTLRPMVGTMLKKLRRQWPDAISAQDEHDIVKSAIDVLLAGDGTAAAVEALLADTTQPGLQVAGNPANPVGIAAAAPPQEISAAIDPSLAAFRDWQHGKLDLLAHAITLADLRRWLNWWLTHDPQRANQDSSLMLSAIDAQAQDVADPVRFMKLVLACLKSGEALDLEALSLRSGHRHDNAETPVEAIEAVAPPDRVLGAALQSRAGMRQFVEQQDARLSALNSAQLHQIIRAWLSFQPQGGGALLFLSAIEAHALEAVSIHAFLREVLLLLIADQPVDLEQLLADTGGQAQTSDTYDVGGDEPLPAQTPAAQVASALPAQLKQALPQRLASAMLQADFASLEIIWPEIVRSHAAELAQAAQRYLGRSDIRARLIARADAGMLKDLLEVLSRSASQLAEPLLRHSAQCGAVLATPMAGAEFAQCVLRFAFEQAFKPDSGPIEWLHALIHSMQEMADEQRTQLLHAWYEVLRAGRQPALLLQALGQELFGRPARGSSEPEPAASLLLMCSAEPDAAQSATLVSLLHVVCSDTAAPRQGALESALADPRSVERLADALPSPMLARVFAILRPALAAQLPAVLRQLHKTLPIPLAALPATLDLRVWRAIYLAVLADGATIADTDFMRALVRRLASQYRQADPLIWLDKFAAAGMGETGASAAATPATSAKPLVAATPSAAVTPAEAMTRLLQPWAEPKVAAATAKKPAAAARGEDEPQPFIGESNIHNAGMVIVVPYVQRLFGLLELTADGKFVSDEAAQRGVHLLQYVVTGEESTPEYLLMLNKLLCGIHGGVPIVPGITVTDKEKTIIEQMLNGVISHWSALGTTSIGGLRETFLQRQGHLYFQDDAWQLKIPQKTFDMLLDRLPWSFALTKMPWMAQPLHVTWR